MVERAKQIIAKAKGIFKGSKVHEEAAADAEGQMTIINGQLEDLKIREGELLGKKPKEYKDKHAVKKAYDLELSKAKTPAAKRRLREKYAKILEANF